MLTIKNDVNLPEDMDAASRAAAAITQAHPASISGLTLEEVRDRKVTISLVSLSKAFKKRNSLMKHFLH